MPTSIQITGADTPSRERVLTPEALDFVAALQEHLGAARDDLLRQRVLRQEDLARGIGFDFLEHTESIRGSRWQVAPAPSDLEDRRVEITGPVERKMMINALNSGASVFMADFEDALSPTWENVVEGQANLQDAVRRQLEFRSPEGKEYRLNERTATLLVRPRGWHLVEHHARFDGTPVSASLFDFGLYFFHNAEELVRRGSGPYFYLPKLESHLEAQLWNRAFTLAQDLLRIPHGTIRATVLVETIAAAFEMDEILWELRDHAAGLNAGRWDYIFSIIRLLPTGDRVLPDRGQVTMAVPFMRAYTDLLVATCHLRGAHAIGGMAAFIPSRRDEEVNRVALQKVREDKEREARQGFDGTWVAHPDLVPVAKEIFDRHLGDRPHQKHVLREDVNVTAAQMLDFQIEGGRISEDGVRSNISIALQYIDSWLQGQGAAGIRNLMEDAATAEISRSQLWQWIWHGARLDDGRPITPELYRQLRDEELAALGGADQGRLREAAEILDRLVLSREFVPFLTIEAYGYLDSVEGS
ncbi:MAG TPA: malate synthase A [Thermoanaerobaculia bacterium]|jgi:malate synthase|nr:malate synthase A [Thermoanaerobaculia bacterium]